MRHLLPLSLLASLALTAHGASTAGPVDVDTLSESDVSNALSAIKGDYVRKDSLTDSALARATLQGLLDRLASAVTLTGTQTAAPAAPFYSELYNGKTGYLRLGALTRQNVDGAGQTLASWSAQGAAAVIVDLRGTPPSDDFTTLSPELAGFFCPDGTRLFGLEGEPSGAAAQSGSDSVTGTAGSAVSWPTAAGVPRFAGIVVVIVDAGTAQAPEAVAAFLQKCARALVVGDRTAGQPYKYRDIPLGNAVLRVAIAEAVLPGAHGHSVGIGDSGVTPDISAGIGSTPKSILMQTVTAHGIASVTSENDRPHLTEAALESGSDPEVDELEAEQASQKPAAPLIDRQLQRALDLVTSISVYNSSPAPAAH